MSRRDIDRFSVKSAFAGIADQASLTLQPHRAAVIGVLDMRVVELLTTRLCHELSGPITAINNGIELLSDELSPGRDAEAFDFADGVVRLLGDSARRAATRLQFYRFAYGFGLGGGVVGLKPRELASRLFEGTRIACDYAGNTGALPLDHQKLACNLLLIGAEALSGGGSLVVTGGLASLDLEAIGEPACLSPETTTALMLATPIGALTSQTVQAYFTGLLAEALGYRLIRMGEAGRIRVTAVALAD